MKKPKVSIITVYYNRSYCVSQSVESLLNQTFRDFELLLVDDGSTDTTLTEFSKFNDPRIRIVTHPNMGFTNSISKAVELAEGEYIAIHGSGDVSHPDRIEKQCEFLDKNPDYVVVASRFERYDEETLEKIEDSPFMGDLDHDDFVKNSRIMHGAVMYRKSTYTQVGGYESFFKTSQDWDMFLRFLKVGKGRVTNELLYRQYKRRDGVADKASSYEKTFKTYALLVKLAIESEKRNEILGEAYSKGLYSVISNKDLVFQEHYISASSRLIRMGRYDEFLKNSKHFEGRKDLTTKFKLKYYGWWTLAKTLEATKLDSNKVRTVFSKVKFAKDRLTASIHKFKGK